MYKHTLTVGAALLVVTLLYPLQTAICAENRSTDTSHKHMNLQSDVTSAEVEFTHKKSMLDVNNQRQSAYEIIVHTISATLIPAEERRDIALVFANGILVDVLQTVAEKEKWLEQQAALQGKGSSRYNLLTLHYALVQQADHLTSERYAMSEDHLYVLDSALSVSEPFREPKTNTEKQWQRILDKDIYRHWQKRWEETLAHFRVDGDKYEQIPLHELMEFENTPLFSFTEEQSETLKNHIWDMVHDHYAVEKISQNKPSMTFKGSTMPLILIRKDGKEVQLLYQTERGMPIQFKRDLNSSSISSSTPLSVASSNTDRAAS